MQRATLAIVLVLGSLCSTVLAGASNRIDRPNIILIVCDNLGYGDIGCYGSKLHRTPHIDRMAAEGMRFTDFYVTSGVCTPSRASIMTGCYPRRVNMHVDENGRQVLPAVSAKGLHTDEITVAEILKARGYATAIIGKWHLGDQLPFLPTRQGFDYWLGIPYSDDMVAHPRRPTWPELPLMENEKVIEAPPDRNLLTKRYTEKVIEFVTEHKDEPFFVYLPHAMPGSTRAPFASEAFRGKSANGPWGDSVEELDWSAGQILAALKRLKLDEQTLVIWTNDNGAPRRNPPQGTNLPLAGWGYTTAEGGMRSPCIMRWPGKIPVGTTCSELCTTMDLLPTFARLAGTEEPQDRIIDGHDIWPLISGQPGAKSPYEVFYYYYLPQLQAVRSGRWKLYLPLANKWKTFRGDTEKSPAKLFDLVADLSETTNLVDKHPDVVKRLTALANKACEDLGDLNRPGKNQRPAAMVGNPTPRVLRAPKKAAGSRPNIVFMLADDMGWAQPGFNGGNKELTPNIDKLAAESLRLTQFYTHSVCAPTRGAFLTGRYAFRNWTDWRSEDFGKPSYLKKLGLTLAHNERSEPTRRIHALDTNERTIAEALKEAGYFTGLIGKWHCGEWLNEHLPMQQGFMHQYGHYAWGIDYYTKTIVHNAPARFAVYDWHRNQQPLKEEGYATDLFAAEVERVIARQTADKPFFLYVPFNAVHGPLNEPPRYTDEYDVRSAMLKCLDDAVGRIVSAIDKHGFEDNTLIVFTNDNGPVLEEMSKPYRGTKNTTFEGGVRVPCLVRWPGHTHPGSTNDGMMFIADWFSTFITLGGGKHEQELPVDAVDMTDMLFASKSSPRNEIIFEVTGSVRLPTIRSGDYKLMSDMLFNIREDPSETTDIAAKHPEIVKKLAARLEEVGKRRPSLGNKPLLMDPPLPYVYGLDENKNPPDWLKRAVDKVRAKQPKEWAPGETPWPQAPKGANASK